jgi:hypothetical protein
MEFDEFYRIMEKRLLKGGKGPGEELRGNLKTLYNKISNSRLTILTERDVELMADSFYSGLLHGINEMRKMQRDNQRVTLGAS